jgi:gliding motility-associated protein GldM
MAIPREPRQKMINLMYLVLTAMLALNVSAEVIEAFKTVDNSLQASNVNIENSNKTLFSSLQAKLSDPNSDKAKVQKYKELSEQAKKASDDLYNYIETLKTELKSQSGLEAATGKYKEDDLNASSRVMETNKKADELNQRLAAYRNAMLALDPETGKTFATTLAVENESTAETVKKFRMMPTTASVTLLSKYQNNVKNAENQLVNEFHSKIGQVQVVYNKFAAIVGQSSNYVMPGEKIKVTAGVGAFSTTAQPTISIGGSGAPVNANGVAEREFTADGGGKKSVPVNVSFVKPDGTRATESYTVEYTVGTPGGAAVMADKMNVFYIGVDNPVTIGSPAGWDRTTATISSGSMTGSGSARVVRVSSIGNVNVNVTVAGGKTSTFPFRVKRIPDPVMKVGPSYSGNVQAVVFRNQNFLSAVLENFDFAASFRVIGATCYVMSPGARAPFMANLGSGDLGPIKGAQLVPGTLVTFDNVKVVGPDGVTRTILNPPSFRLN